MIRSDNYSSLRKNVLAAVVCIAAVIALTSAVSGEPYLRISARAEWDEAMTLGRIAGMGRLHDPVGYVSCGG